MATSWSTYPIEFKGGLITNMSPLQQGINAPGSARILKNFEPSIEGGYRRILGFTKFDSNIVPPYGNPVVHGASQTGTTLVIAAIHKTPEAGDTFTVAGISGTYTIASGGVSFDDTNNRATLTLTGALASSPANGALLTFASTTTSHLINGVTSWEDKAIVSRNNDLFKTTGSGYTKINKPTYGTVLVNGGSQSGGTLAVDGLTSAPRAGDVFTIAGVDKVYTVTADATVSSGGSTLNINPNLASSPSDDAAITFISTAREGTTKIRFASYNFSGTLKLAIVDGANQPALYDDNTFTVLNDAPTDVLGAKYVVNFKNQLIFAKGSTITFTAPYTDSDFTAANGSGTINVGATVTGLAVFREQLVIFTERSIFRLVGDTIVNFQLQPITRDIGCLEGDTIQEIGGDVIFLAPDGLRLLSGTERIGDFGLGVISKSIQKNLTSFIATNTSFSSVVIREKSQYRLFGFNTNINEESAQGIIATQFSAQGGSSVQFGETRGIRAYVAGGNYNEETELTFFANNDGYVYKLENGNNFDGSNIATTFATPFVPVNDPRVRKAFYKVYLYADPQGSVAFDLSLKFDFDEKDSVQPSKIDFSNTGNEIGFYGTATYGVGVFGTKLQKTFEAQTIGSGFTVSMQFESNNTNPPYSLDALTLEYDTYTRR